ncbi:MAG: IscS subfamily cysteine desulfurase [Natronospirillum sp.]
MPQPIYLDYAATTPVDPRVAARMAECLTQDGTFANPASRSHVFGWQAEEAVEHARGQVAKLLNCDAREIVWTSGATEADNLALKGAAQAKQNDGKHIVVSAIEHKAVLDPAHWLAGQGFDVTFLAPDASGRILPEQLASVLRPDTILVSLMHVNNELGTVNDIAALGALCRANGSVFHVDAAQSVGKLPLDMKAMPVDLLSLSAHKFYGPKGIGALYVRRAPEVKVLAQLHGGGHERGMRSGTLPTHQCVGLGLAAELAGAHLAEEAERITGLRNRLWHGIAELPGVHLNGHPTERVSGILNVAFAGQDSETLLMALRDIAIATGSACTSASVEPSFVLKAIGLSDELAHASLRLSVGRFTSEQDIDFAVGHIRQVVSALTTAA